MAWKGAYMAWVVAASATFSSILIPPDHCSLMPGPLLPAHPAIDHGCPTAGVLLLSPPQPLLPCTVLAAPSAPSH